MPGEEEAQALSLNWVYGTASAVSNNVVNLSDGFSERVCYLAAHTAVIYDKRTQRQQFMQGHCNAISCLGVTSDRSTLITGDVGSASLLVLWDAVTGAPIASVAQPHAHGVLAMDVSPDDEWLATISAPDPGRDGEQEIALWSLAAVRADAASARPVVLTSIPAGDTQTSVAFNMNDVSELVSNGKRRAYFWSHAFPSSHRFKYYSPPLRAKDFKQAIGDFTHSVFVPGGPQALTATSDGDLVVWDEQGVTVQVGTRATDRRAIKLMRIHSSPVTVLTTVGDYIVSGGADGFVRFYDPLLRIVAWFEDLCVGPIAGIAFSAAPPSSSATMDAADTINRFMAPDFVVSTAESRLLAVQSASFEEYDAGRRRGTVVLDAMRCGVADIASHPTRAEFAVLNTDGTLQRWDSVSHVCVSERAFPKLSGACVSYSRDGGFLVAGFDDGYVHVIDTESLQDIHSARNTPARVCRVVASTTGEALAVADARHHVLLYCLLPHKNGQRWEYVGKSQAHHAEVVGLQFGESPSGQTRLFSLGADGRLAEYDLAASSPSAGLVLGPHTDLPPPAVPSALAFAPPLPYFSTHATDTLLLVCDDAYKVRLFNPDAAAPVATFLGPTFAGPIAKVTMFKSASNTDAFLAYATKERVVGLLAWPMDGDPSKTMGLIAHPGAVSAMAVSYDGRKLLTAGDDGTLCMWDVRAGEMSRAAAAVPTETERWRRAIHNPGLVDEMMEYFLYAQIKAQGEGSMAPRSMPGRVPVSMLPDLMRAAGYYPSEAEVAAMTAHVSFLASSREATGSLGDDAFAQPTSVAFDDVVCLYSNHRPLAEVSQADIDAAFIALGANPNTTRIGRDAVLNLLQTVGEPMSAHELLGCLHALTGAAKISDAIPHNIDARKFATDVLGFDDEQGAAV
ncbi:hypothetical protein FOA52_010276 [Chlamydomonas sp. UWO 241]|nr:hypothetical protein FOA52_010276 [Chlamydomonas sp. UWO 241]